MFDIRFALLREGYQWDDLDEAQEFTETSVNPQAADSELTETSVNSQMWAAMHNNVADT